jgi:hypothetical protein
MQKHIFVPAEQTELFLAAFELSESHDNDRFIEKVERIFLTKLAASSEQERLLGITQNR